MADTEKALLYTGLGFFGMLYLMSHFRLLRPSNAKSLSSLIPEYTPDQLDYYRTVI